MPTLRLIHGNMAYAQAGAGTQPVLLLHGLFCCKEFWDNYLPLLPSDCYAIVPDLLGHGDSDEGRGHSVADHVAALRELLDALNVERVTLAGHSMGGALALAFALAHPERVERLLLAMAPFTERGIILPLRALQTPLLNVLVFTLNRWATLVYLRRMDGNARVVGERMLLPSRRTIVECVRGLKAFKRNGALRQASALTMPTLCLHSPRDGTLGSRQIAVARALLPQAQHVIVPDVGHTFPLSDAERFAQIANLFLRGLEVRGWGLVSTPNP
jgi:pimeloyl-ACP methyl ester carboxylesterase